MWHETSSGAGTEEEKDETEIGERKGSFCRFDDLDKRIANPQGVSRTTTRAFCASLEVGIAVGRYSRTSGILELTLRFINLNSRSLNSSLYTTRLGT